MGMPPNQQRLEAQRQGLPTYLTGKACKHGHFAPRNVSDSSCTACRSDFRDSYRAEAAAYAQARRDAAIAADPEGTRKAWADKQREMRRQDPEKFRARERYHGRLKRQRNPKGKLAEVRKRQAAKLQRTPGWADTTAIRRFYEACPDGHTVDHVIPLRGRKVSGLHVLENLQYLTSFDNLVKGNRYEP